MSSEHSATHKSLLYTLRTKTKTVPVYRINNKKTIQLVQEFEKAQCLWNTNLIDYPNRIKRRLAYQAIAEKLNVPNMTGGHIMVKLKNLRNAYCQEVKKMAAHKNYKPKVPWFETMHRFLSPHVQTINTETMQLVQNARQSIKVEADADDLIETTDWVVGNPSERDKSSEDSEVQSCSGNKKHTVELNENNGQVVIKRRYSEIEEDLSMSEKIDDPLVGIGRPMLGMDEIPTTSVEQTGSEHTVELNENNGQVVIKRRYSEIEEDLSMSEKIDDPLVGIGRPMLGMDEIPTTSVEQTGSEHTVELNENNGQVVIKRRYSEIEEDLSMSEKNDDPLVGIGRPMLGMDEIPTTSVEQTGSEQNMRVVDHYDAFGTYVATLLRSLPWKKALMLQPRILNLIVEELNDDEMESS